MNLSLLSSCAHKLAPRSVEIVSVHSIVSHLSEDEKDSLSYGFGSKTIASRSKVPELLSAYSAILAGEDNKAMSFKATSEGIFLKREEVGGGGGMTGAASYTVPIERVCARLKLGVLEGMVEEMFGRNAVRIFRVIGYEIKALEITVSGEGLVVNGWRRECATCSSSRSRQVLVNSSINIPCSRKKKSKNISPRLPNMATSLSNKSHEETIELRVDRYFSTTSTFRPVTLNSCPPCTRSSGTSLNEDNSR